VTIEALVPDATTGLRLSRSGGHEEAQAPVHALRVPESFWKRYSVLPWLSTKILPRLPLFATPTVAGVPLGVVGGVFDAVAALLLLPHAARLSAASGTTGAAAIKRIVLRMVIGSSMSVAGASRFTRASLPVVGRARALSPALPAAGERRPLRRAR